MSTLKTQPNEASVEAFLEKVTPPERQADCHTLLDLMQRITGEPARMWGPSMVGFGSYHYRYASGREGDWFLVGFSPRKQNLTLYLMPDLQQHQAILDTLGKHKMGKGCLYLKQLSDADPGALEALIRASVRSLQELYPDS